MTVDSITPSAGGDTGSVTIHVNGGGFLNGGTAKLVRTGEADIVGQGVNVSVDGHALTSTFDLSGHSHGTWSLIVANPDGTVATLTDAFAVEGGRAAELWVDIVGPSAVRGGRPTTFYLQYGNRGNVDSEATALLVSLPKLATWRVVGRGAPTAVLESDESRLILLFLDSSVPASAVRIVPLSLTSSTVDFQIRAQSMSCEGCRNE